MTTAKRTKLSKFYVSLHKLISILAKQIFKHDNGKQNKMFQENRVSRIALILDEGVAEAGLDIHPVDVLLGVAAILDGTSTVGFHCSWKERNQRN
jgi:hypothetical protein